MMRLLMRHEFANNELDAETIYNHFIRDVSIIELLWRRVLNIFSKQ